MKSYSRVRVRSSSSPYTLCASINRSRYVCMYVCIAENFSCPLYVLVTHILLYGLLPIFEMFSILLILLNVKSVHSHIHTYTAYYSQFKIFRLLYIAWQWCHPRSLPCAYHLPHLGSARQEIHRHFISVWDSMRHVCMYLCMYVRAAGKVRAMFVRILHWTSFVRMCYYICIRQSHWYDSTYIQYIKYIHAYRTCPPTIIFNNEIVFRISLGFRFKSVFLHIHTYKHTYILHACIHIGILSLLFLW